jgi:hypothetical protein
VLSSPFGFLMTRCLKTSVDLVGRNAPLVEFTDAFEDFVDGKVALEDEVAAVSDLADRMKAAQVHRCPLDLDNFGRD